MNLTTTYLGMNLKNPLVVAASPLSAEIDNVRRMEDCGAAAVVLHSLFEEQLRHEAVELDYYTSQATDLSAEATSFFPEPEQYLLGPVEYLEHLRKVKQAVSIPIIASLNGVTRGGWIDYARQLQQAGADALELNVYLLPTNPHIGGNEIENVYLEILAAVKEAVTIPVAMKLSPFFSSIPNMCKRLERAGAAGLVLFNRFYQPDIDLESLEVEPRINLSGPGMMLLPLRWIAILRGNLNCSLAASTGVHTAEDVIKMIMAGADVTQLCAVLMRQGIAHLRNLAKEMTRWMEEHEYVSVAQMQGSLSQAAVANPAAFERANYMKALQTIPLMN